MAIDRYVVIAADHGPARRPHRGRLFSMALGREATIPAEPPFAPGPVPWARYIQGVVAFCPPGSFDAVIASDVPVGGGLSSSAALEVAAATLFEAMTGTQFHPLTKALLCQKAEHDFACVPCAIMD